MAFNEINDRSDDIISWEKAYKIFFDIQRDCLGEFLKADYFDVAALEKFLSKKSFTTNEQERIKMFMIVMNLIAQASSI